MAGGKLFVTLNTGAKMPMIGLGTWKSKPGEVRAAVEAAIDAGYRHIDCALCYGNENEVGDAIQAKIQAGVVKREDLFITSKLWLTYFGRVREGLDRTLKLLKVDYVDLYLMHWPFAAKTHDDNVMIPLDENGKIVADNSIHYTEVWKEMEKLPQTGLTKAIGISNFNKYQMEKLLKIASIVPAMHQYECHPYFGQEDLFSYSQSKGMAVTAYSPFGSPDRPAAIPGEPSLFEDPVIKKVGEKYGKSNAQVIVRYMMQRGLVVIPKSVTPSRIQSNFQVFDFELNADDMAAIKAVDINNRLLIFPASTTHKYYPFQKNYSE